MTSRLWLLFPWLIACGGDDAASEIDTTAPEIDAGIDADFSGNTEAWPDVDVAPIGPAPALEVGAPFALAGATSLGAPLTLDDDPTQPWIVPMLAGTEPVVGERGAARVIVLGGGEHKRLALVPVTRDGAPMAATTIATGVGFVGEIARCGDALWVPYQREDGVHVTRVALVAGTAPRWSLGARDTVDLVTNKAEPGGIGLVYGAVQCLAGRAVLGFEFDGGVTIMRQGTTVGSLSAAEGAREHEHVALDAVLDNRTDVVTGGTDWTLSGRGDDGTLLLARNDVTSVDVTGIITQEHTLHRFDFATTTTTSLIDHRFTSQLVVLLESSHTVIVCGYGAETGAGFAAGGHFCLGLRDGAVAWVNNLSTSYPVAGVLIDDTVWLTSATQTYADDGTYVGTVGNLIGLDAQTGDRVAYAEHRVAGYTLPLLSPRPMVGEGRCAGARGIGVLFTAYEDEPAKIALDQVIAGPNGTTCAQSVAYLERASYYDNYALDRASFGVPAPGPCREQPHLVALTRASQPPVAPGMPSRPPLLITTQASDCGIAVESREGP